MRSSVVELVTQSVLLMQNLEFALASAYKGDILDLQAILGLSWDQSLGLLISSPLKVSRKDINFSEQHNGRKAHTYLCSSHIYFNQNLLPKSAVWTKKHMAAERSTFVSISGMWYIRCESKNGDKRSSKGYPIFHCLQFWPDSKIFQIWV